MFFKHTLVNYTCIGINTYFNSKYSNIQVMKQFVDRKQKQSIACAQCRVKNKNLFIEIEY